LFLCERISHGIFAKEEMASIYAEI